MAAAAASTRSDKLTHALETPRSSRTIRAAKTANDKGMKVDDRRISRSICKNRASREVSGAQIGLRVSTSGGSRRLDFSVVDLTPRRDCTCDCPPNHRGAYGASMRLVD